ncbi:hypothetical protein DPMN_065651 [Dreissena polymorpha]|uniref:Uncharacterized protein n=1 Tax=Dreissena polymorpha TaxID=45954 RepID=A0A9D3YWA4_DREPO|nr:hypothetical protein DPMN_065651 [Dreissena polymorpha]
MHLYDVVTKQSSYPWCLSACPANVLRITSVSFKLSVLWLAVKWLWLTSSLISRLVYGQLSERCSKELPSTVVRFTGAKLFGGMSWYVLLLL